MIFQEVYGKASGPVTILGAPNETVTYTGKASGSVTLNSSGKATVTLIAGEYDFVGSFSSLTGVLRKGIKVRPDATVTMWPDTGKMIYWFGRVGTDNYGNPLAQTFNQTGNASYAVNEDRTDANGKYRFLKIRIKGGDSYTYIYGKLVFGPIRLDSFKTLRVYDTTKSGNGAAYVGYGTSTDSSSFAGGAEQAANNTSHTFNISSVTGNMYVGARLSTTRAPSTWREETCTFRAIWLEV